MSQRIIFKFGAKEGEVIGWKNPFAITLIIDDDWVGSLFCFHVLYFRFFARCNFINDGDYNPQKRWIWLTLDFFLSRLIHLDIGIPFWRTVYPKKRPNYV